MRNAPSNADDVIDSRDIIARIEELEGERDNAEAADSHGSTYPLTPTEWERNNPDDAAELAALTKLAEDAEGYADDWKHGETLIRDSYFRDYAEELAEDIGTYKHEAPWPHNCIDWDQAVRELQMDYTAVDFDGVTYWVR